jgi:hypothetical protein
VSHGAGGWIFLGRFHSFIPSSKNGMEMGYVINATVPSH